MQATFQIVPGDVAPLFEVFYIEPSKNTDGSNITNLDYCSTWYSIDGRSTEAARVEAISPTGGNSGSWTGYVAVPDNTVKDVTIWATATNKAGNTSTSSSVIVITVDRTHEVPNPPT